MVSSNQVAEHVRSVHAIISRPQRPSGHELVARSWLRCFHELGLDPAAEDAPPPLAPQAWRERGDKLGEVMDSAVPEMQTLHRQLDDPNSALVLADAEGVIVSIVRHPGFAREASLRGLVEGARWSEDIQGTNGIGTVLAERHSLVISREEHFFARHTDMVCAAAPIYDGVGEVAAVLAVCSLAPGGARALRALVERSARVIEHRAFRARHATDYIIRFHAHAGRVLTAVDGMLALTPEGEVIEANHTAFELLSPEGEALLGREVTEFFGQSLPELLSRTFRSGFHPLTLSMPQHQTWHLLAQQPARNRAQAGTRGTDSASAAQALAELDLGDLRMAGNVHSAMRILDRDIPLLISGETGTGKEVFARAFHASSQRARGPFVAINCASLPEALIESELFGYKQGAFTGANRDGRRGKVLQADGGTLFLDEIGDMPLQLQARLLRVLEERKVTPLGGENAVPVDLQLVCATHRDLRAMVREGSFREDLYYRLRGMEVTLPALRDRTDRRALIERCLTEESAGRHPPIRLGQAAMQVLDRFRWPGNIRQMRYVLRTLVALCDGPEITLRDMPPELMDAPEPMPLAAPAAHPADPAGAEPVHAAPSNLNPLQSAERDALLSELRRHRWNIAGLARELGVSRNTVYRKMKRLDIDTDTQAGDGY
ncbi:MAG: sigma-54-dependent Fis family transcriptional regulator [Methyloversatilis discipulorum]|jgi:transcriptional regulator of acetoin/glycerol metabolism|uniref:sigma-54-dependent Fis family transcriptional regulator n=1 Tax=Methyloversatilis discipulorum TaxID=1119528 RepID=UPI0026EF1ECE|nr:sigma-54-dependent Fis family transcriptional regulator [Methyloversatilis discipulorum]MBV5286823.1 sigma-54-dependent Fis family transcriptional regulator [Methyloversatilis discipulorum]